jgi:hypothetical protein
MDGTSHGRVLDAGSDQDHLNLANIRLSDPDRLETFSPASSQ